MLKMKVTIDTFQGVNGFKRSLNQTKLSKKRIWLTKYVFSMPEK